VIPALAALVALQKLDTAAETATKRLADMPAAEEAIDASIAEAGAAVEAAKASAVANQEARRALEKEVAGVDTRLSRFEDHKAAVKTNQEFTALLHEIETAKTEKDTIEEKILELMEEADALAVSLKDAEGVAEQAKRDGDEGRAALAKERGSIDEELARLQSARKGETSGLDAALLARYEQLLKGRRGVAVAAMSGETCAACYVRLRPHVAQQVRRNDDIVQCESCQRILYYEPPADA
jgi:predicted  nucleic acid-binding Zn-ribbon protein